MTTNKTEKKESRYYIVKTINIFNAARGSDTLALSLSKIKSKKV